MENINKPLSVSLVETKENIIKILNEAYLHPILVEMILDELHTEVKKQVAYISQIENEQYKRQQELTEENDE